MDQSDEVLSIQSSPTGENNANQENDDFYDNLTFDFDSKLDHNERSNDALEGLQNLIDYCQKPSLDSNRQKEDLDFENKSLENSQGNCSNCLKSDKDSQFCKRLPA